MENRQKSVVIEKPRHSHLCTPHICIEMHKEEEKEKTFIAKTNSLLNDISFKKFDKKIPFVFNSLMKVR